MLGHETNISRVLLSFKAVGARGTFRRLLHSYGARSAVAHTRFHGFPVNVRLTKLHQHVFRYGMVSERHGVNLK